MRDNNTRMTHVIGPLYLFLFFIVLGIITYFFTGRLEWSGIVIAMGSIAPLMAHYQNNIYSPRMIDIQEDGFLTVYRNGRSEFIPWTRIKEISYYPGDPIKFGISKIDKGAYLLKDKEFPYMLKDQLGKEMREAYARRMGKYPPMWGEG